MQETRYKYVLNESLTYNLFLHLRSMSHTEAKRSFLPFAIPDSIASTQKQTKYQPQVQKFENYVWNDVLLKKTRPETIFGVSSVLRNTAKSCLNSRQAKTKTVVMKNCSEKLHF